MLNKIKDFFDHKILIANNDKLANNEHALRLAMAALMVEVAESDYDDSPKERESMLAIVKNAFDLSDNETTEIIEIAREEHENSVDYFQFTQLINKNFNAEQRIDLIEKLWRIAFADNILDKHEAHVIRRIADLLHVSHSDLIKTKLSVQKQHNS